MDFRAVRQEVAESVSYTHLGQDGIDDRQIVRVRYGGDHAVVAAKVAYIQVAGLGILLGG